jgi:urease accessory protein
MSAADMDQGPRLLQLIWLASPALPVGGFSYSEGLEAAVEGGWIRTEDDAAAWLTDQLWLGPGRSDLPVLGEAILAWREHDQARVEALNRWLLMTRETREMRGQLEQMGRSMLEWLRNRAPDERLGTLAALRPAPTYPLAFALAAAQTSATPREAMLSFAFGWAENMVQAAVKSVPLGQNAGQRILSRVAALIPAAVEDALHMPSNQRQSFSPMLAILSAAHETQYSRLFRS